MLILKKNIITHRSKLNNWLRKGNDLGVVKVIDNMTKMAIKNSISNNYKFKAEDNYKFKTAEQLNLRMSLLKHFGCNDMADRLVHTNK